MVSDTLLLADQLRTMCDPDQFTFTTTNDLEDLTHMVGQARAIEAVEFGIGMDQAGYNLFVLGPPGTGRHSFVQRYLTARAAEQEVPSDWCYVNNFDQPREPIALELPAGRGRQFCHDMDRLIDEAYTAMPAAFESDEYTDRRKSIQEAFSKEQAHRFQDIQERAGASGIGIIHTPNGLTFEPLKEGLPMPPEDAEALPDEEKERLGKATEELRKEMQEAMESMPHLVRDVRSRIHELDRQVAMLAAGSLIDELLMKYSEIPKVLAYLQNVQKDIIDNFALFLLSPEMQAEIIDEQPRPLSIQQPKEALAKRRYCGNLIVDHGGDEGAPVVVENHPIYPNLVGEVEYLAYMGALETDFSLIHGGAIHRANGGYLILDVMKVLSEPFAWEGLKQALKSKEVRIESLGKSFGLMPTVSLEPEPIPLNLKVVLIGDRLTYYQLQELDPEFLEHFKVAADFDDRMDRDAENNLLLAQLLGTIARQEELLPLDRTGVARLIEESARHAEHNSKLSAQVRRTADIMREANYWAEKDADGKVDDHDIQCAIEHRIRRASRIRERLQEGVLEGSVLIDTAGAVTGQINGLAVLQVGDFAFARPSRITARVSLGRGAVVDIERETDLGGPLHSKGILILSGYLASTYAADIPLSLSASIVMEQSYGGVDGDSASAAELVALLSAMSGVPIKQSFAITGSVNQRGCIQAIGGVNEKIEGFFDICMARKLTGDQGVIIPASNIKNLMLRQHVVEAVREGAFHIHAITTIDEAVTLLTGVDAGVLDEKGVYPEGSVNMLVRTRLETFAQIQREFGKSERDHK